MTIQYSRFKPAISPVFIVEAIVLKALVAVTLLFSQISLADENIRWTYIDDLIEAVEKGDLTTVTTLVAEHKIDLTAPMKSRVSSFDSSYVGINEPRVIAGTERGPLHELFPGDGASTNPTLLGSAIESRSRQMLAYVAEAWTNKAGKKRMQRYWAQRLAAVEAEFDMAAQTLVNSRRLVEDGTRYEIDSGNLARWKRAVGASAKAYDDKKKKYEFLRSYLIEEGIVTLN